MKNKPWGNPSFWMEHWKNKPEEWKDYIDRIIINYGHQNTMEHVYFCFWIDNWKFY